jgi:hypothetical protein
MTVIMVDLNINTCIHLLHLTPTSLYMGTNTSPQYHHQISRSPFKLSLTPHTAQVISLPQVTPIEQVNHHPGKIIYPSLSYQYGNPGYYCDPLQFPVSSETQTSPPYIPYPNTSTHVLSPAPECLNHVYMCNIQCMMQVAIL